MDKMKKIVLASPIVLGAASAFAQTSTDWWKDSGVPTFASSNMGDLIGTAATFGILVVVAVAGARVFMKLINRGAGK